MDLILDERSSSVLFYVFFVRNKTIPVFVCICIFISVCVRGHVYMHIYVFIYVYTRMYACMCANVYEYVLLSAGTGCELIA